MHRKPKLCKQGYRCGNFRHCEACARIRQAHFASLAEKLLMHEEALFSWRLTPHTNSEAEIRRLKAAVKVQLRRSPAVWTVEQGERNAMLHLNIISGLHHPKPIKASSHWVSEQITNLRHAAAYILKRSQIPEADAYTGRQFGNFHSLGQWLIDDNMPPLIQAAAIETNVLTLVNLPTPYLERQDKIAQMRGTRGYYGTIADNHLLKFRAAVANIVKANDAAVASIVKANDARTAKENL